MSGEVVHFEIPADDVKRARSFYEKAFGWKMMVMPEQDYTMVTTGAIDAEGMPKEPGYIGGGIAHRGEHVTVPVVTIMVDDIEKSLQSVQKNGGKVLQKKQPIGDGSMGFTGYFHDSEGNTVGLFQRGSG
jgi:uncharacterized protein